MTKRICILTFVLFFCLGLQIVSGGPRSALAAAPAQSTDTQAAITESSVIMTMRQMADWQISALGTSQDESWETATFFIGLMALYQITGDSKYFDRAVSWGTANNWTPASNQSDPPNQDAGQAFLEMYLLQPSANRLTPTEKAMDTVIAQGGTGRQVWRFIDDLFGGQPTFARVGGVTGSTHYFDFMSTWY